MTTKKRRFTEVEIATIKNLYKQGISKVEIAKRLNRSHSAICGLLAQNGMGGKSTNQAGMMAFHTAMKLLGLNRIKELVASRENQLKEIDRLRKDLAQKEAELLR